ncbi:DNA-directed DNA polymerase [Meiothermus ruber DSM 1279]|nr:DNA-directed DNA polymerase [Meiothermus ruber]ADD29769.1 DNA-directed DNA polymerase [Meiothermus ruber DSM 1279]MCL6529530.1 DNA polymerase [Meiothermus ruber]GIW39196.1 MAG: DNA polymerase IV [Meiothermus sp.]
MGIHYLFLDMNAFFASVEQQLRPELRGKPVAVVPMLAETTCCIATSYEAKRYGIKTGTLVQDARLLCPGLELVEARPREYIRVHHQILQAVDSVLPVEAVLSIDELVCKLMGREREPENALQLGRQVKEAIYRRVGGQLRCSVGLGPNRFLAKVAAEMHKPDGLTLLQPSDLPHRLYSLQLRDLPGIGPGMERRLFKHGVTTVEGLYRLSALQLAQVWGSRVHGLAWWHRLRGADLPETPTRRRSLGHSHVLPPALRSEAGARAVLTRLVHRAAARLRHEGYWAGSLALFLRFLDGGEQRKWEAQIRIQPSQDTLTLLRVSLGLWQQKPEGTPFKVGIALGHLTPALELSEPLFESEQKLVRLAQAMDKANSKYGPQALYFAGMHRTEQSAVTRIAFNRIPDLDLPEI